MIYNRMLFGMGILPGVLDEESAEVVFDVLGAETKDRVQFIDEV